MAKLNFEHEGQKLAAKGEWDGDTFTAQVFKGKKPVSDVFSIKRDKKDDMAAPDEVLEETVLKAAKDDVLAGNGMSSDNPDA